MKERRRRQRTVLVHDVNIPPVESLDCLYVGSSFSVGVRGGSGREVGGGLRVGCYRFRKSWTEGGDESSMQTNSSDRKRVFDREKERRQDQGERRKIPTGAVNRTRLNPSPFLHGFAFRQKKILFEYLKKKKRKIFLVWGSVSLPLFTDGTSHLLLLKVVLKITNKKGE